MARTPFPSNRLGSAQRGPLACRVRSKQQELRRVVLERAGLVRPRDEEPSRPRREARLTPFLVLQLDLADQGVRPVMKAIQPGMRTLVVSSPTEPEVAFNLTAGTPYTFSGEVVNLGRSPALTGLASVYIVPGNVLMSNWDKAVPPFDVIDFQAWPGRRVPLPFRRTWVPDSPSEPLGGRISIFIHVQDLAGDRSSLFLTNTGVGRHIARKDYRLD